MFRFQKPFLPQLLLIAALTSMVGCDDDGMKPHPPIDSAVEDQWIVYGNVRDPRIAGVELATGEVLRWFGERDASGIPTEVYAATFRDAGGEEHLMRFADSGGIEHFVAANGVSFRLTPLEDGRILLQATSSDGESNLQTIVDTNATEGSSSWPRPDANAAVSSRLGLPAVGDLHEASSAPSLGPAKGSTGQVQVVVSRCGQNIEADQSDVWVRVYDVGNEDWVGHFPAHPVGAGVYQAGIPTGQQVVETDETTCNDYAAVLSLPCEVLESMGANQETVICAQLSAALVASGIGAAAAPEFLVACEALVLAQIVYCNTLGYSPDAQTAPDLAALLCGALFDDGVHDSELQITPYAHALPDDIVGNTVTVPANFDGPLQLGLDLGGNVHVEMLRLTPAAPAAYQDYMATSKLYCLHANSLVSMNIIGTDGCTDGWTEWVDSDMEIAEFELRVPGAESGIIDEVTLKITPPGGAPVVIRRESLVFGAGSF